MGKHNEGLDAEALEEGRFWHFLALVLFSANVEVRAEGLDDALRARCVADHHPVYVAEGLEHLAAFVDGVDGGTLGEVLVMHHGDDKMVSKLAGPLEVENMADVKEIEYSMAHMEEVEHSVTEDSLHARKFTLAGAGTIGQEVLPPFLRKSQSFVRFCMQSLGHRSRGSNSGEER